MFPIARGSVRFGLSVILCLGIHGARAQSPSFGYLLPSTAAAHPVPSDTRKLSLGVESLFRLLSAERVSSDEPGFRLDLSGPFRAALSGDALRFEPPPLGVSTNPRRFNRRTIWVTAGAFTVVPVVGALSWWRHERVPFHVRHEGWFDRDSYAGGADKASHFVISYAGSRVLTGAYEGLGHSPRESRLIALGVTALSGVLVEVGDGTAHYGFSWQDIGADMLGALTGIGIDAAGIGDLVGFRYGWVGAREPASAEEAPDGATDYSREIYTADFKLSGVLRRLKWRPGVARFLLFSMTYGSKGYLYSSEERRQRNVGLELSLNVPEILRAVGVRETSWWGKALTTIFEFVRVPYTGIGYQYDLKHGRWHGPTAGNVYDPGP